MLKEILAQIAALGDILHHSLIQEQLEILERSLFHKNICDFTYCEISIASEVVSGTVIIHRQMLELAPSNQIYITCEAFSETQVPVLHGILASETLDSNLIFDGTIFSYSDLKNTTMVNQKLRLIKEDEHLLQVFHTFGKFQLQCLQSVEFELNEQKINCAQLQKFKLEQNFTLTYKNEKLRAQVLINHNKKLSTTWLDQYTFGNIPSSFLPMETPQENILPEAIHQIIFTEAGNINVQGISLFTSGTVLFILCSCAACCYKCERYREFWKIWVKKGVNKIYTCLTSEKFRIKKENVKMRKDIEIKKETIRKNLEDIKLYNQAIGQKNLPTTHVEDQAGAVTIKPGRKGVTWRRNSSDDQGNSSTTMVEINSVV